MKAALAVLLSVLLASSAMAVTEQLKETGIRLRTPRAD